MKKLSKRFNAAKNSVEAMAGLCDYGCSCGMAACLCGSDDPSSGSEWSYNVNTWQMESLQEHAYRADIA